VGQRNSNAEEKCFRLDSHAEARTCLEASEKESAVLLGRAEVAFRSALTQWDEVPQIRDQALAAFDDSIVAFRHYRKTQCEVQASLAAGGNSANDRRLLCLIELNMERTSQLEIAENSLE
jgi:uncharacterized protein YecT (DUF1311 family)